MRLLRLIPTVLLVISTASCENARTPSASLAPTSSSDQIPTPTTAQAPGRNSHQVPDSDCPEGWTGLTVTTDSTAEIEYLDDMPACKNAIGDETYLENMSDAVWLLRSTSTKSGTANPVGPALRELSFVAAVAQAYPGQTIFVPGAKVVVNLAPEEVEWVIDLPLSFGWQAHDVVVDKIAGAGEKAAADALRRRSPAGAALAICTLAVTNYAKTVSNLPDADPSEVLVSGLGMGVSASQCRSESAAVGTVDETGRSVALADELERLTGQTKILEKVHGRIGYAQKALKLLRWLKFS